MGVVGGTNLLLNVNALPKIPLLVADQVLVQKLQAGRATSRVVAWVSKRDGEGFW